jgi:peptide/nickel transport system permease protein
MQLRQLARMARRRLAAGVVVLFGVTLVTFFIAHVAPGDPAEMMAGPRASPELVADMRARLGLDQPVWVQYGRYMQRLASGDFGESIATGRPALAEIASRIPATIELMLVALLIATTVGIALGVLTAAYRGTWIDTLARGTSILAISTPAFWLGLLLLLVFYDWAALLPGSGRLDAALDPPPDVTGLYLIDALIAGDGLAFRSAVNHLVLPAATLALGSIGALVRVVRSSMLEVLSEDYIRTARAAGLPSRTVLLRHALPNALIPLITVLALELAGLMFGSVIVESVFSWPGVGRFVLESILRLDFPVIMCFTVLAAVAYLLANLLADMLDVIVDPRIREIH